MFPPAISDQYTIAVVDLMLNDLGCEAFKGFDPRL
jgi:hypothetical protein